MRRDSPPSSALSLLPWLLDANSWSLDAAPGAATGVWPVGNGQVFAHAGLGVPANRLQGIVGPTYQTEELHCPAGDFGDCWVELETETGPVDLPDHEIWRPRRSGVLVTKCSGGPVALITVDAALPERPVLLRFIEVWGTHQLGEAARVVLRFPAGAPHDPRRRSLRAEGSRGKVLVLGAVAGRDAKAGRLSVRLGDLPHSGGVQQLVALLACGHSEREAVEHLSLSAGPIAQLEETREWWSHWLGSLRVPELWPQHLPGRTATVRELADLIEINQINLRMQQAAPGGGVGPMVHRKGVWASECSGPVRAFLQMRALDEVRELLDYYYRASIALNRIPECATLDLDVSAVREPADWSTVSVPHVEIPSWIVLQHRWWLEAGGDVDLVRRHWGYLRRCATGQTLSPEGFQTFHGDETYLHGALYSIYPERSGWPNQLIAHDPAGGYAPWSLDSMVLYVAAHEAMAWMSTLAGRDTELSEYQAEADRVRASIERHFWMDEHGYYAPAIYPLSGARHEAPFAPVNLRPLWLGYHAPDEPRAQRNLQSVVELLGFGSITPTCEYTVGHAPGYMLWDLLQAGSDLAPLGLAHLASTASPAGEWAEVHAPGGAPHYSYDRAAPNRLRPCESGVNLDAIYRYFQTRGAGDEPEGELRGIARATGTSGSGPVRAVRMPQPPVPEETVLVTADSAELDAADAEGLTVIEAGLPMGGDYFAKLLFDPTTGARRVNVLILGESALAGDRRSMKPPAFWSLPQVAGAFERFEAAGGRLVRPHH